MHPKFTITAWNNVTNNRMTLFTWTRGAEAGIERAKRDAEDFGLAPYLTDYRADPIDEARAS